MAEQPLFLEDLHVGRRFVSATRVVDAEQIKQFASQFDPQPFHMDDEAAAGSFFGGLVASGWHTAALTMRMLVDSVQIGQGVIGGGVEVAWPRPTLPGDELHVESEVIEVRPSRSKPDRGMVLLQSETRNQHGEVVQLMTSKLLVPRKS